MAERDMTPIKVTLDRQRPYRAYDEDREAVWVGPGEAEVPTWVAQEWGMVAKPEEKPAILKEAEKQLEGETGKDVVKTGDNPPTFVETDKPAKGKSK